MGVLYLRDTGVKAALRHPALAGLKRMARGAFCAVYDKGDTVLKLTCDAKQYALYADAYSPEGPYFPTLVKSYGDVGETCCGLPLFLVEMEKLQPVSSGPAVLKRLARSLLEKVGAATCEAYCANPRAQWFGPSMIPTLTMGIVATDETLPLCLREALEVLETFFSNYENCGIDFHGRNLMRRGEQLVLNDVVADLELLN